MSKGNTLKSMVKEFCKSFYIHLNGVTLNASTWLLYLMNTNVKYWYLNLMGSYSGMHL